MENKTDHEKFKCSAEKRMPSAKPLRFLRVLL